MRFFSGRQQHMASAGTAYDVLREAKSAIVELDRCYNRSRDTLFRWVAEKLERRWLDLCRQHERKTRAEQNREDVVRWLEACNTLTRRPDIFFPDDDVKVMQRVACELHPAIRRPAQKLLRNYLLGGTRY